MEFKLVLFVFGVCLISIVNSQTPIGSINGLLGVIIDDTVGPDGIVAEVVSSLIGPDGVVPTVLDAILGKTIAMHFYEDANEGGHVKNVNMLRGPCYNLGDFDYEISSLCEDS